MKIPLFQLFDDLPFFVDAAEGHDRVRYEIMDVPITLPSQKPPSDKPNPKQGVGKSLLPVLFMRMQTKGALG